MYELNGYMYSLEEVQAAADRDQLSLEEFISKKGLTKKENDGEQNIGSRFDHISEDEFNVNEDDLKETLEKKYAGKGFRFETARPGIDAIRVYAPNDKDGKVFKTNSGYNKFMVGENNGYANFRSYLDTNNASEEEIYNANATGLSPDDYIEYNDGTKSSDMVYNAKLDKMVPIDRPNIKRVDAKKQKELIDLAATEMSRVLSDPTIVDGPDTKYAANAPMTQEFSDKIHKHVYDYLVEETGLNIDLSSYNKMVGKMSMSGLEAKTQQSVAENLNFKRFLNRKETGYGEKSKKLFELNEEQWLQAFQDGDRNKGKEKIKYNEELQQLYKDLQIAENNLESEEGDKAVQQQRVDDITSNIEEIISEMETSFKETATTAFDPMDRKIGITREFEVEDRNGLSSMLIKKGYREQSRNKIQESYDLAQNTMDFLIQNKKLQGGEITDYDAQVLLMEDSFIEYKDLLELGDKKTFKLNFSDYNQNTIIGKSGTINTYDPFLKKVDEDPRFKWDRKTGNVTTINGQDLTYNDLESLGLSGRSFDGWADPLKNKITGTDKEWLRIHESAVDENEGFRYAMWSATRLNIDPSRIKKSGFFGSLAEATAKQVLIEAGGYSTHDADKIVAGITGENFTERFILDEYQGMSSTYNNLLQEEIKEGKAQSFEFTKEQAEYLDRSLSENVSEGVGHMVPTLIKLGAISTATGGVLSLTGAARALQGWKTSAHAFDKIKLHASLIALEEIKMQVAGFKPLSGASFYAGGAITRGLTPFKNKFTYLDPFYQKVVKGGPVFAGSMELASVAELWYDDLMGNRDFKSGMIDLYGDMNEVEGRLLTNVILGGILGASHLKKSDFYSTKGKMNLVGKLEARKKELMGDKNYENLDAKTKEKIDGLTQTQEALNQQVRQELTIKDLDMYGGYSRSEYLKLDGVSKKKIQNNFEKAFNKKYTTPFNAAIKKFVPEYKGFTVKFYEGGKNAKKLRFSDPRNTAEFIPEKNQVLIDKSMYTPGKEIHEFGHAAFRAVFNHSSMKNMKLRFEGSMAKIFDKYDQLPGTDMKLTDAIKEVVPGDGRTREVKDRRAEEYITYMMEFLSNPVVYTKVADVGFIKEVKQEFRNFGEEYLGIKPKINTPTQFIDFLGRLAQGARKGRNVTAKIGRLTELDKIDFLQLELAASKSKAKNKNANFASRDLIKERDNLLQKNKDLVVKKPEGWREQNQELAGKIKELNKQIETSEKNDANVKRYKEAVDARNELFEKRPELKDTNVRDPKLERAASELRQDNMGILTEFVSEAFKPVQGSSITRADFKSYVESVEFNKVLNSYFSDKKGPSAFERGVPFGAYLRNSLFGPGYIMGTGKPQRQGNVLKALQGGRTQDQTIKTVSMFDAEGKVRSDIMQLSTGESTVLDGGTSARGSVGKGQAEAGLINVKEKFDLSDKYIKSIESKLENKGKELPTDYSEFTDMVPELTISQFGGITKTEAGKPVVFRKSNKNIEEKINYINEKAEVLYEMLPKGAMIGFGQGAKAKAKEGKSTNIEDMLLNGRIYEAASRVGSEAQASFAKTGSGAGLPVQQKLKFLNADGTFNKAKFLEKFNIFLNKDGTVDFNKTKIKGQSKDLRAIDALIAESGKSITHQITRNWLEKTDKKGESNYSKHYPLAQEMAIDAFIRQLSVGKSESLASRNLYDAITKVAGNETKAITAIGKYIRNRDALMKSDPALYGEIKDMIETQARIYAKEGGEAFEFMQQIKNSKFGKMLPANAIFRLSDAKFKENPAAQRKFEDQAYDLAKIIPSIDIKSQVGNAKILLDLFAGHYNIVGSAKAKVESAFKQGIRDRLASKSESILSPELQQRWNSINWSTLKSAYASSYKTGYKKIMKAETLQEQRELAQQYFNSKEGKESTKLYDVWNSTLQEWLYSSKEGSKEFLNKADYILKIKKANGAIGTTGERVLAPTGYVFLPGKAFEGTIKYEHLKSSSQQSFESAALILDGSYTTKGKKSLAKYRGIYGLLGDFNMVDKATGRVNNSDIFRFAENLELAKNIYKVDGNFKTSLYDQIVKQVGKEHVKRLESIKTQNILDKAVEFGRDTGKPIKGLSVFDFDDTLAKTNSQVIVTMPNGKKFKINATEFAKRDAELSKKGAKYDFSEFNKVIDGQKGPLADLALKRQDKFGSGDIYVLTARPQASARAIQKFLKGIGLDIKVKNITGLADGRPEAKAEWIAKKASEGYNDFYFADDAAKNVKAVKNVLTQLDVKSDVQQALASRDLSKDWNKIMENKTGIAANKVYSKAKAQVQGANKGRFKFFIPPSAEDFVGLIYPTLGKGKLGDVQMAWYKKNLLDPFARAENAITKERHQLMKDFRTLKKEIKSVPKNLRTKIKEGPAKDFTKEQAMRVYIWNKQGMEIPGLSKKDARELVSFVKNNKDIRDFADRLILMHKGDSYTKPTQSWLAGTITTDIIEGINTVKRAKHLKEWKTNRDIIFSEANLNKYEAAFGFKARQALENILGRMETGTNRKKLGGAFQRLENEVLDWTNNSVGAIMFLNSRSAVLQTISAINYVNFRDNNPLAAAKAFGNQKQYWSDFNKLFNSEYLVQRRDGLKININEAEIVEMAATSKNKAKAAISYLLNKGFVLTRHADSFAIASGGAAFYRNRINTYIKQGLSKAEAEAKAFKDFREITEESQQSSRTDRISAQQASGLGRVVLAFANTPMQYARLQKRAIQDLANGRGDAKTNLSKIVYYGFVQNVIFNALQQAMFAIGFDEDEDNEKQIMEKSGRLLNGMLDSQLRGLGYGGAAVSTVKNILHKISEEHSKGRPKYEKAAWEMLDFAPPISSKVTKVRSALRSIDYDLEDMKSKGFSLDNPAYMAGGQVLSATVS